MIHGYTTLFPAPLGMASSWDPAVEEQAQAFAARETRAAGITWTFTPMVDVARAARWGRIQEGGGGGPGPAGGGGGRPGPARPRWRGRRCAGSRAPR